MNMFYYIAYLLSAFLFAMSVVAATMFGDIYIFFGRTPYVATLFLAALAIFLFGLRKVFTLKEKIGYVLFVDLLIFIIWFFSARAIGAFATSMSVSVISMILLFILSLHDIFLSRSYKEDKVVSMTGDDISSVRKKLNLFFGILAAYLGGRFLGNLLSSYISSLSIFFFLFGAIFGLVATYIFSGVWKDKFVAPLGIFLTFLFLFFNFLFNLFSNFAP